MKNSVQSWSIQSVYKSYGTLLGQYAEIDKRIAIPKQIDIKFTDDNNVFIMKFWRDVNRIDDHLKVLDAEISRRNNLVGVMG